MAKISNKSLYKKNLKELKQNLSFRELIKNQNKINNRKNLCKEKLIDLLGETQILLPLMQNASEWVSDLSIHNLMDCDGYHIKNNKLTIKSFSRWFQVEKEKNKVLEEFEILANKEKIQDIEILLAKIKFLLEKNNLSVIKS